MAKKQLASMKVLAFTNAKGGVGKTTSALNVGIELARRGHRVLLVDTDPQADLTTSLGFTVKALAVGNVLLGEVPLADCLLQPKGPLREQLPSLRLLPSSVQLMMQEPRIYALPDYHLLLAHHLQTVAGQFDYAVIDCPPALGTMTYMAFCAADAYVVPSLPEKLSFNKLKLVTDLAASITAGPNPRLTLAGIFFTRYNAKIRRRLNHDIVMATELMFGADKMLPAVRQDVALAEAQAVAQPTHLYMPACNGVADYSDLTTALLERV